METVDNPESESTFEEKFAKAAGLLGAEEDKPEEPVTEQTEETTEETTEEETEVETADVTEEPQDAFTIFDKDSGKEIKVSKEEAKNGYLRQQDYTRKTMEVADQRKVFESQRQQAEEQFHQFSGYLGNLVQQIQSVVQEEQSIDWDRLRQEDPVEYAVRSADLAKKQAIQQQALQTQSALQQQFQQDQSQKLNQMRQQEFEQLLNKVPDWKDPGKRQADNERLMQTAQEYGITPEEYGSVVDHRHMLILRDAMLYRQMQQSKGDVQKKVANLPKVMKPGTQKVTNAKSGQKELVDKLRKTGDQRYAVEYFKNAFGD